MTVVSRLFEILEFGDPPDGRLACTGRVRDLLFGAVVRTNGMVHTGRVSNSNDKSLMDSASTWMQVVFGGLGVCVAIVALVIAYFAWVQPHSPDTPDPPAPGPTKGPPTRQDLAAESVALSTLTPTVGVGNVSRSGDDLVIHCASGESTDRFQKIEYDLLGRYTTLEVEVRVSKARDNDTPLQLEILADRSSAANRILKKPDVTRLSVPLAGRQTMQVQLTCQFSDGEITLSGPKLIHT